MCHPSGWHVRPALLRRRERNALGVPHRPLPRPQSLPGLARQAVQRTMSR